MNYWAFRVSLNSVVDFSGSINVMEVDNMSDIQDSPGRFRHQHSKLTWPEPYVSGCWKALLFTICGNKRRLD